MLDWTKKLFRVTNALAYFAGTLSKSFMASTRGEVRQGVATPDTPKSHWDQHLG